MPFPPILRFPFRVPVLRFGSPFFGKIQRPAGRGAVVDGAGIAEGGVPGHVRQECAVSAPVYGDARRRGQYTRCSSAVHGAHRCAGALRWVGRMDRCE